MKKLIQISLLFMLVTSAIAQNSQSHQSENANVEIADEPISHGWLSPAAAIWVSVIGSPIIGCLAGLLGILAGKGKARRFVLTTWKCLFVAGIFFLIAAVIAGATGQPDYIFIPLLLFGILPTTILGALWPLAKKSYDDLEIRRMTSIDTMGS
jgi:hypothetical protein